MRNALILVGFIVTSAASAESVAAVDWSTVPARSVTLFHPGQTSWEWIVDAKQHSGARSFLEGKACNRCHVEDEQAMGASIAINPKLEPRSMPGRPTSLPLTIRAAHDATHLRMRLEWPDTPGYAMPGDDKDTEIKLAVIIGDQSLPMFERGGCWAMCHDDLPTMSGAHPNSRATLYLKAARASAGTAALPTAELGSLLAGGRFLEYWQLRVNRGRPAAVWDGLILDGRKDHPSPRINGVARLEGDRWVVELSRPLVVGRPGHKDIVPGRTYTLAFALHDDYAAKRFHLVSLERSFAIGNGDAEIRAVPLR